MIEQVFQILTRGLGGEDAVLETIVVEDIAERGRNDAGDAEILARPRRMLTGRTATEIVAADKNLGAAIGRLVAKEIRAVRATSADALIPDTALPGAGGFLVLALL